MNPDENNTSQMAERYLTDIQNYKFYDEVIDDDTIYTNIIDDLFGDSVPSNFGRNDSR
jgi:hypothetical protein